MIDALLEILETFGYPVFLHGSMNPDDSFPDCFFTFWNASTPEGAYYSNSPHHAVWKFLIYCYGNDRETVESTTDQAFSALRAAGWTLESRPCDAATSIETYTGRMFTVKKMEFYRE